MTDTEKKRGRKAVDENWRSTQAGLTQFVEMITPWLFELGGWIFGALIAFNLVILGVTLTIGPVDLAVKIATAAFAFALPPSVAGFVLLRVVDDMRKIRLNETATQAFQQAGFTLEEQPDRKEVERKLSTATLRYTYTTVAVTLLLTLTGLTAVLWHSAWWIAAGFVAMLVLSQAAMLLALGGIGGRERWRSPRGQAEPEKEKG